MYQLLSENWEQLLLVIHDPESILNNGGGYRASGVMHYNIIRAWNPSYALITCGILVERTRHPDNYRRAANVSRLRRRLSRHSAMGGRARSGAKADKERASTK